MESPTIEIYSNQQELAAAAAEHFAAAAERAIASCGWFTVALSGGSTPMLMYRELAEKFIDKIQWAHVHFFWSDEREVGPDDPNSNYKLAADVLFAAVNVPAENIHRVRAELGAKVAALQYEQEISATFAAYARGKAFPQFDLVLLGMGDDGHTASLFPGTAALAEHTRIVAANVVPQLKANRVTFTLPLINAAHEVVFVVSGYQKAHRVREVIDSVKADVPELPAALVDQEHATWMLDAGSSGELPQAA